MPSRWYRREITTNNPYPCREPSGDNPYPCRTGVQGIPYPPRQPSPGKEIPRLGISGALPWCRTPSPRNLLGQAECFWKRGAGWSKTNVGPATDSAERFLDPSAPATISPRASREALPWQSPRHEGHCSRPGLAAEGRLRQLAASSPAPPCAAQLSESA